MFHEIGKKLKVRKTIVEHILKLDHGKVTRSREDGRDFKMV